MTLALMKRIMPYLGIAIVIGLLCDSYIFYSRWSEKHDAARVQAEQDAALAKKTLALLGGSELKINSFYVSPGAIRKGSSANICYSVTGAKKLKIDPPVEEVWPAMNHCLQVTPAKNTEYRLTAEDAGGHSATESFVLQVIR